MRGGLCGVCFSFSFRFLNVWCVLILLCIACNMCCIPQDRGMASLLQRERSLPVSHHQSNDDQSSVTAGMRRRLSLQIHPSSISDTATAWAMRRSKSMGESASSSIRNWWDWGWGWIIFKKTVFTQDLEFNQLHKTSFFSSVFSSNDNNSTWKHVFLKLRSEIRNIVSFDNNVGLPRYTPTKF